MSSLEQAVNTQIRNIRMKTGKSMEELAALVQASGLTKHGEIRAMLMQELGLGHGDANALVHAVLRSDGTRAAQGISEGSVIDALYAGPKSALRPIHDRLMVGIDGFGPYELVPKKGYVSLRRKKQFAMIGPATNSRVELGLNAKGLDGVERLKAMPAGSMCNYTIRLADVAEVDEQVIQWLQTAYDSAG